MFGGPILHDNHHIFASLGPKHPPRTGALAAPETRCAAQALGVTLAFRAESEDFVWQARPQSFSQKTIIPLEYPLVIEHSHGIDGPFINWLPI